MVTSTLVEKKGMSVQRFLTVPAASKTVVPVTFRNALLDGFVPQDSVGQSHELTTRNSSGVTKLVEFFINLKPKQYELEDLYEKILAFASTLDYSAKDIESIVKNFGNVFQRDLGIDGFRIGIFISALINASKEKKFFIDTSHLDFELNHVGFRNTKIIMINGNIGHGLGKKMEHGVICVYGNCEGGAGLEMKGGSIVVLGDCGAVAGLQMENGELIVYGNIDLGFGGEMQGGVIRIESETDVKSMGKSRGHSTGRIYIKGTLVMRDGFTGEDIELFFGREK